MHALLRAVVFASASLLPLAAGCYGETPPPEVAPDVDLARFQGKWFEIAKLPRATETDCTGTVASYWLRPDGELDVISECRVGAPGGPARSMTATARVPDRAMPAKLALEVHGFFGDHWILELGEHYEYAVVGHPSREYLWILSRTPSLDPDSLTGILERARADKFDVDRLEYTRQAP
jgi:apolipoprotein D and lipocalin family protein